MLSVIETELWLSAVVVTKDTVGAVVSVVEELSEVLVELSEESSEDEVVLSVEVVDAPSSLLLAQEMTMKLKRDMRIMYKTLFIFFLHQ